jgi:lambda family phage minor tail protein L
MSFSINQSGNYLLLNYTYTYTPPPVIRPQSLPTSSATKDTIYNAIRSGNKSLNTELSNLTPTTPVYLYELDLTQVYSQVRSINVSGQPFQNGILRFHNGFNIYNLSSGQFNVGQLYWQNNYYYPFPVTAEGFDCTSAGTLPNPTITLSNNSPDQTINSFYKYIRMQFQSLGDIVGAKFTRIKTFLKYLDPLNFSGNINPFSNEPSVTEIELPRDIFYVDRKETENKDTLKYSLVSILDLENLTLPGRTLLANKCPFEYRGEGCLYEYNKRITSIHSGVYGEVTNPPVKITLPLEAPPVATENDELFLNTILSGEGARARFSGINYFLFTGSYNQWAFTNYALFGTAVECAQRLNDGSTATTAITSNAAQQIITLSSTTPTEITCIRLNSSSTINNNYQIQYYSNYASSWNNVSDISGYDLVWNLNGSPPGTYKIHFPSKGYHSGWRFISTTSNAGTALTEFNFSGQFRIGDSGMWQTGSFYQNGDFIFLENHGIKYYFVCISGHTSDIFNTPPNKKYWGADSCSKTIHSCRLRWQKNPYFRPVVWPKSRGGWDHWDALRRYRITGNRGIYFGSAFDFRRLNFPSWWRTGDLEANGNPASWPRRPDVHDPWSYYAHGLPKDMTGQYLNGLLPFGGFPGLDQIK